MAMTDSQIIDYYIDLYQKGEGSLSGLWYNIQTPLINLQAKEQRLQVQEKRNQEQATKIQEQERKIQEQKREIDIYQLDRHKFKEQLDALKKEGRNGWFWWP